MPDFDPTESHLEYQPPPERPSDFDRRLKSIVGLSPNGIDLNLRFVWGMDQTEILDGKIIHRYPDPDGQYVGINRWVLEGWQNPDVYDEKLWRENEDLMGPWPTNGVWDFIAIVEDEEKRYLPLGSHSMQMARNARFWKSKPQARALTDLLEQRCKRQVLKEKRWEEEKQNILDEFVRDYSRTERGGFDPRKRTQIGKISKGEYQETPFGILIPKLA